MGLHLTTATATRCEGQKVGSWQHNNCTRPCAVAWASSGCVNGASRETSYPSREVASSCHSMGLKMFQDVSSKGPTVKTQSRLVNERHHVSCCKLAFTGSLLIEPRTPGKVPGKRPSCLRKRLPTCPADDLQVCGKSLLSFPSKLSEPNPVVPVVCRLD